MGGGVRLSVCHHHLDRHPLFFLIFFIKKLADLTPRSINYGVLCVCVRNKNWTGLSFWEKRRRRKS
jgi:hypothetical protein